MKSSGSASDNRPVPAVAVSRDEPAAGEPEVPESIPNFTLFERVLTLETAAAQLQAIASEQNDEEA